MRDLPQPTQEMIKTVYSAILASKYPEKNRKISKGKSKTVLKKEAKRLQILAEVRRIDR